MCKGDPGCTLSACACVLKQRVGLLLYGSSDTADDKHLAALRLVGTTWLAATRLTNGGL